ncbi:hypothetical protein LI148_06090, partial [Colidextribacter sp. 210702-DFI.3.9]|nr:hypothetical protein [Colidextribacter sp. 210702-DFI.3.9]
SLFTNTEIRISDVAIIWIVSFLLRRRAGDQYDLLPLLLGCKVVLGQISSKVIFRFSHFDT